MSARRVVTQADAGRGQGFAWRCSERAGRLEKLDRAGDGADLRGGDGAGAVDDHRALAGVEDGGLDAMFGGAGVEDGVDAAVEVVEHVLRGGGADVAEEVGAGRGDGEAGFADEREGDGMRGHADADERASGGDGVGHGGGTWQQQRERTGPEGGDELAGGVGNLCDEIAKHGVIGGFSGDVNDDWIPSGALLCGEDARDGGGIEGIGTEAVDRFSGQGDEAAAAQDGSGVGNGVASCRRLEVRGVHAEAEGLHGSIVAAGSGRGQLPYTHYNRWRLRRRSSFAWRT